MLRKLLSRLKEQRGSMVNELDFSNLNLRSTPADMIHARISVTGCIRKYIRPVLLRCVTLYTMERSSSRTDGEHDAKGLFFKIMAKYLLFS